MSKKNTKTGDFNVNIAIKYSSGFLRKPQKFDKISYLIWILVPFLLIWSVKEFKCNYKSTVALSYFVKRLLIFFTMEITHGILTVRTKEGAKTVFYDFFMKNRSLVSQFWSDKLNEFPSYRQSLQILSGKFSQGTRLYFPVFSHQVF